MTPADEPALPIGAPGAAELVFAEPWQAQAFALAVALARRGVFTWGHWTETLAGERAAARERGEPDDGGAYYRHWLAALEKLAAISGLVDAAELARRKQDWERAVAQTGFGRPIELARTD